MLQAVADPGALDTGDCRWSGLAHRCRANAGLPFDELLARCLLSTDYLPAEKVRVLSGSYDCHDAVSHQQLPDHASLIAVVDNV